MKPLPYGRQYVDQSDIDAVSKVLEGEYLTTGPKIDEFELQIAKYTNSKFAVAVNSGTSALDIAVGALDLPTGSEIITTPLTFAASANCALYHNHTPIFADIDPQTYNISPSEIEKKITKKTTAIVYVDYAGQPCDIDEIREIAQKYNLYLIEDAAHAFGATYKGKKIGSFANMTEFSFHPVKHITTGEGGAITTDDPTLANKLRLLRTHGIDRSDSARKNFGNPSAYVYDMVTLGRNYRITDIQCALGISQLKKIDLFLNRRKEIAKLYNDLFEETDDLITPFVKSDRESAFHLYPILLPKKSNRDIIFSKLREMGIGVNVHYIPTYKFTYYKKRFNIKDSLFPNTEEVYSRLLTIPMYYGLTDEEVQFVASSIKSLIKG